MHCRTEVHQLDEPHRTKILHRHNRNTPDANPLVSLDFPEPLQQRVINALNADPKTVDLRGQAPHFYALGARIMDLFEDKDVLDTLISVCGAFP